MSQRSHQNTFRAALFFIFTVSGFAGLIYELIWTHYLKLFLGHAAYAQTLVLMIFMGGMAIGAWLAGFWVPKIKRLFLAYAFVEVLIGFAALGFDPFFRWFLDYSLSTVIPAIHSEEFISLYKWGLSSLIILPQSILLGMTFPLMSNAIIRQFPKMPGEILAMLYFTNSFGAAIGVLYCGFVLIPEAGLPGTLIAASALNCLVALLTWVTTRQADLSTHIPFQKKFEQKVSTDRFFVLMISTAFITGLASFMYEIGWIRLLTLVLGAASHSFELMLSSFILGLALGGLWIKKRIDHLQRPVFFLSIVQMIMGLFALLSLYAYSQSFHVMEFFMKALMRNNEGYFAFNWMSYGITMMVMLPTTFCAGMTLPLITRILLTKENNESAVGYVYAGNTIGSIVGVIIATHLVMPILSLKAVIVIGALFDIGLGVLLWRNSHHVESKSAKMILGVCSGALLFFGFFFQFNPLKMASGVFRTGRLNTTSEVIFIKDGKTSTVTVSKQTLEPSNRYQLIIATNGKPDASFGFNTFMTGDEGTQILLAALPLAVHPNAQTAAVIGFGSGMTSQTLLRSSTLQRVDTIEIEPAMAEGAKLFQPYNSDVFHSPRSHIHFQDAKVFFANSKNKYDLIVSEPSNPWVSGVASLFTEEFYHQLKKHLAPRGIFCQWLHTYEMNWPLMLSMLKALDQNFSYYTLYAINNGDIMILASNDHAIPEPSSAIFKTPALQEVLKKVNINSIQDINIRYIVDQPIFHPYLNQVFVPTNSDYFPIVDIYAVKARFLQQNINNFRYLGYYLPFDLLISTYPKLNAENISRDPTFARADIANQVWSLYQLILNPSKEGANISNQMRYIAGVLNPLHPHCIDEKNKDAWVYTLYQVGVPASIYLSSEKANTLWKMIGNKACLQTLPTAEKTWLTLFQAISNRDPVAIQKSVAELLKKISNPQVLPYLVGVGMIADYALHQPQSAHALWQRYAASVIPTLAQSQTLTDQFGLSLAVLNDLTQTH